MTFVISAIIGLLMLLVLILGAFSVITFISAIGDYDHGDPNDIYISPHKDNDK